jgi:hypothetical protein
MYTGVAMASLKEPLTQLLALARKPLRASHPCFESLFQVVVCPLHHTIALRVESSGADMLDARLMQEC